MNDGPNIVRVAALIGDHTRAQVLTALLADRAVTATELAAIAGVTKQTISTHLAKLLDAGLIAACRQGRHRYFRLADRDVAQLLEYLMGVAFRTGAVPLRNGPREPALRKARICYDHLAGELGVLAYERLLGRGCIREDQQQATLTARGTTWFTRLGVDVEAASRQRRPLCRACLDWGERRHHLAGTLGRLLLDHVFQQGWAMRVRGSRAITFRIPGEQAFRQLLERD